MVNLISFNFFNEKKNYNLCFTGVYRCNNGNTKYKLTSSLKMFKNKLRLLYKNMSTKSQIKSRLLTEKSLKYSPEKIVEKYLLPSSIFKLSMVRTGTFELGQANTASFMETQISDSICGLTSSFSSEIFSIRAFEVSKSDLTHDTFV